MIQLTENLAMSADPRCFIVGQPCQRADKGMILRDPTYHTTAADALRTAVQRALRQGVADGSITTLRQLIQEQEQLAAEFERLIAPLDQ